MAEITTQEVRDFLSQIQGQTTTLDKVRHELGIEKDTKSFTTIRNIMFQLAGAKVIRYLERGVYKVVLDVNPVQVFGTARERRAPFDLWFPRDFDTGMEMDFAQYITFREGDLITIGGVKSTGKTLICLLICAENIDSHPVLMGNEYTNLVGDAYEPSPRFLNRLDIMRETVEWTNEEGMDKFELLPVREDYAEHIKKDRINIIDWINLDGGQLFDIGKVLEGIKRNLGRGVAIIALQKGEGALGARGGQFVRDFSDVEILLDGFGDSPDDVLLTVKGVKEKTAPIVGRTYTYTVGGGGTTILNFREVVKCHACWGKGWKKSGTNSFPCDACNKIGWVDKGGIS